MYLIAGDENVVLSLGVTYRSCISETALEAQVQRKDGFASHHLSWHILIWPCLHLVAAVGSGALETSFLQRLHSLSRCRQEESTCQFTIDKVSIQGCADNHNDAPLPPADFADFARKCDCEQSASSTPADQWASIQLSSNQFNSWDT